MATPLQTMNAPDPANDAAPLISADDVNTSCIRAMEHLRRQTRRQIAGRGIPPWEATTTRPGGWVLVGELWLAADPATRWTVWCQAGSRHVGLRVQVSRATHSSR